MANLPESRIICIFRNCQQSMMTTFVSAERTSLNCWYGWSLEYLPNMWYKKSPPLIYCLLPMLSKTCTKNCTTFSHEEFLFVQNTDYWYCRLCNKKIFPFNQIETDSHLRWHQRILWQAHLSLGINSKTQTQKLSIHLKWMKKNIFLNIRVNWTQTRLTSVSFCITWAEVVTTTPKKPLVNMWNGIQLMAMTFLLFIQISEVFLQI